MGWGDIKMFLFFRLPGWGDVKKHHFCRLLGWGDVKKEHFFRLLGWGDIFFVLLGMGLMVGIKNHSLKKKKRARAKALLFIMYIMGIGKISSF